MNEFEAETCSKKKFCSQSCAAKYNNKGRKLSNSTKEKIGKAIKKKIINGELIMPKRQEKWAEKVCPVCNKKYKIKKWREKEGRGKFCSDICARKRPGQGGYREGSVRNYKSGWYISPTAGKVWLDSSYEFIMAEYLDKKKYKWRKNYQGFPYINTKNEQHNYIPDFYVNDIDLWVETKGYFTENDKCKLRDFPNQNKIKLIGKKEIYWPEKYGF